MKTEPIKEVPFLFYVKEGECISNKEILKLGASLKGWLCCAGVLRNAYRHDTSNIKASLYALKDFVTGLKPDEKIQETDLLKFL
jgi:hypothetical protein